MNESIFRNDSTYPERAEQHREDQLRAGDRAPTTLLALAGVDAALESGGRFKSEVVIIGATETPEYPAAASHWSGNQVGLEAPTGIAINDLAPTGEAFEVERSLKQFADDAKSAGPLAPVQGHVEDCPSKALSAIPLAASPAPTAAHPSSPAEVTPPLATERDAAIHAEAHRRLAVLAPKMFRRRRV